MSSGARTRDRCRAAIRKCFAEAGYISMLAIRSLRLKHTISMYVRADAGRESRKAAEEMMKSSPQYSLRVIGLPPLTPVPRVTMQREASARFTNSVAS